MPISAAFTASENLKFDLFATGISIEADALAWLQERYGLRPLTLADYASTSGVTLVLDGDVWVNAPTVSYNPNMVFAPRHHLRADGDRLFVLDAGSGLEVNAQFIPVPAYYDRRNSKDECFTEYVHTHSDRARLSPVRGCAMHCRFCDIPDKFAGRYLPKPIDLLMEAAQQALRDTVLPAAHFLISGGTPGPRDYAYLREAYEAIVSGLHPVPVDIMMAPIPEVFDLQRLDALGLNEISVNVEVWDQELARQLMPEKERRGRTFYLDFLSSAVATLGPGRVRSMLLVGLEDPRQTVEGVAELARLGCTPVLSPFRPDPATPLAQTPPPTAETMRRVYSESAAAAAKFGVHLGPRCIPCSHNTMTLSDGSDYYVHTSRHSIPA